MCFLFHSATISSSKPGTLQLVNLSYYITIFIIYIVIQLCVALISQSTDFSHESLVRFVCLIKFGWVLSGDRERAPISRHASTTRAAENYDHSGRAVSRTALQSERKTKRHWSLKYIATDERRDVNLSSV